MLRRAAEWSALIQQRIDDAQGGTRLRQRGGNATAFLDKVPYNPVEQPDRFVRDVVHHTLRDAAGYVDGMSEESIDAMLRELRDAESLNETMNGLSHLLDRLEQHPRDDRVLLASEHLHKALLLLRDIADQAQQPPPGCAAAAAEAAESSVPGLEPDLGVAVECTAAASGRKGRLGEAAALLSDATSIDWEDIKKDPGSYADSIERLQERCQGSSAGLLRDLIALERQVARRAQEEEGDAPQGSSPEGDRQQMREIHQMLELVDDVQHRLQVLQKAAQTEAQRQQQRKEEEERERIAAAERQKEAERKQREQELQRERQRRAVPPAPVAPRREPPAAAPAAALHPHDEVPSEEQWRGWLRGLLAALRSHDTWLLVPEGNYQPEFGQELFDDHLVITCFAPGLLTEVSHVSVDGHDLIISGCRVPSDEQIRSMFLSFLDAVRSGAISTQEAVQRDYTEIAAALSKGRVGRFRKVFRLPHMVSPSSISARYARGVLSVAIPLEALGSWV